MEQIQPGSASRDSSHNGSDKNAHRPLLEIACFNKESAIIAARAGADRIELCRDYASGGLSPEPETVAILKSQISIPIYVMIRPHAQSFYYSDTDFEVMKRTMHSFLEHGADGFVFGILTQTAPEEAVPRIDVARNKELVDLAQGRPCTFHRAFDQISESNWDTALTDIVECGFTSILTSGPSGATAIECVSQLNHLVHERLERLRGRVGDHSWLPQIIVGGGVRATNVGMLWERTRAPAFHSAALAQSSVELVSDGEVEALRAILNKAT
ncbi:copper homeostasis CutC domain-containing protein [Aspergillus pseudonomiae]|uniref:Copper homeostasis protein cutC homolog n=1 Tax=Aspergillus pseudonomiae TaxID=1506151 RepID=A0A5N7DLY8_9EURO|nr:copper homeostasis CutC domain-containing protein [Aspergillus pseudonomiae]KAE8406498.1 copper homeostasis CutC domain-containing protein [Aspergillus pseudonomiae]